MTSKEEKNKLQKEIWKNIERTRFIKATDLA